MSLSTFSYCSCGLPSSVLDFGESTTSSPGISIQEAGGFFFVMCLLACVAVASFRFLASSQAGQARKACNLYSAPAYIYLQTQGKAPWGGGCCVCEKRTWVCESPSRRSFFLGREGRILSFSPNRRSRDGNFLRFTNGPPRVSLGKFRASCLRSSLSIRPSYGARGEEILDGGGGRGRRSFFPSPLFLFRFHFSLFPQKRLILRLSSFPVFLRQKAWLLIHHGGFRGLEYQVKRTKNLTG